MAATTATGRFLRPGFADDLAESLAEAWRLLERGVADRRSPLHTPVLATRGLDDAPMARTVVLRAADRDARTLRFHTDARSPKALELARDTRCTLLFYEHARKVQLRIEGCATLHRADEVATSAWRASHASSRACYAQDPAPGAACDAPPAAPAPSGPEDGFAQFVAVVAAIERIEWLWLDHASHRRARFTFGENGAHQAVWLAP